MRAKLQWILVGLIACGLSQTACAATHTGSISGTVRDSRGVAQLGAAVQVLTAGAQTFLAFTDARGHFSAANLPAGQYQVRVTQASFLPALRDNLQLRAGSTLVVNLTLNTLFEALSIMPMRARGAADEEDDWKWTLRSMANRPILRVFDNGPLVVVSDSESLNDRVLKARVAFLAGSDGEGIGGGAGNATSFMLEKSLFSQGTLSLDGAVGAMSGLPTVLRASYTRQFANGQHPQVAVTLRRLTGLDTGGARAALQALAVSLSDDAQLTDFAELQYGSQYQSIGLLGRATALQPFAALDVHLAPHTIVEYRYASSLPDTREEKGFDSAPADLSESGPRLSLTNFTAHLERDQHQEVSLSQRMGKNNFQVAVFSDHVRNAALLGVGDADENTGSTLEDPYALTFTTNGGSLNTQGARLVAQRKFSPALTGTLDVAYGGVLEQETPNLFVVGQNTFTTVQRAAVAAKLRGQLPRSKTRWIASYKWNPGRPLTSVDAFNASPGQSDPYFNLFIRQPLPHASFLPGQVEALIDIRNLLAQGYVPVLGQDGHTLYLVQSARSIRGGFAFSF